MGKQLGAAEAARRLGVSMSTLARWRKQGKIAYVRAWSGAHPRYLEKEVDFLLATRQNPSR